MSKIELTELGADFDASMLESMAQGEWDEMTNLMIREAPRRFVIFQELGVRADGHVAAWGLAFDNELTMIDADTGAVYRSEQFGNALRLYGRLPHVTATVVWIDPEPAPHPAATALREAS